MQCPHCGAEVLAGNTFCHRCRKRVTAPGQSATPPRAPLPTTPVARPVAPGPPPLRSAAGAAPSLERAALHGAPSAFKRPSTITALAIFSFLAAAFMLLAGALMAVGALASGAQRTEPATALLLLALYGGIAVLYLANGIGLWALKPWGRILQIVLAVIGLCGFPLGTLIAILVLVYLFKPGVKLLFSGRSPSDLTDEEMAEVDRVSGGSGVLIAVVIILVLLFMVIIAAIAIPSLLRARIAANEAGAIADVRAVVKAEEAYALQNGGFYDHPDCLMAPSQCLPGQGASLSPFLDPTQYKAETRRGYQFRFIAGPPPAPGVADPARVSRTGLTRYAYVATPSQADRSGVKTICGDASGRVCVMASPSSPELEQGTCPTTDCLDLP